MVSKREVGDSDYFAYIGDWRWMDHYVDLNELAACKD